MRQMDYLINGMWNQPIRINSPIQCHLIYHMDGNTKLQNGSAGALINDGKARHNLSQARIG